MDSIDQAERAYALPERVLAGARPEQMGLPTPCSEWDVRALVNHVIGTHRYFTAALHGEQPDRGAPQPDFAGDDPLGAFTSARDAMLATWREPGAMDRTLESRLGPMPAAMLISRHALDNLLHAWDLARAIGQDENLDPELATQMLAMIQQSNPPRGEGALFQPEQPAPAGATPVQQLAAYLGRTV